MKSLVCRALLLVACGFSAAKAGDCCDHCDHCGCQSGCHKVCRVICETKKVPKVTYSCECEDFCVPGPSDHCVTCDDCGNKKHVYTPTCGQVRTRKKLVKHESMEEVPSYKWVVETVCDACACKCGGQALPPAGDQSSLPSLRREPGSLTNASLQQPAPPNVKAQAAVPTAQAPANENVSLASQIRRKLTPDFLQK